MTRDKQRAQLIVPLLMTLVAGTATILLWSALRKDQESRVADIAEAVSYAARSEMARQLIVQFRAFYRVRDYWSRYALVPAEQWHADAEIELDHFDGLEVIAWSERNGPRFLSRGNKIALDHTPSDEEWAIIQDWLEDAYKADSDMVAGPEIDADGHAVLRIYLPISTNERSAVLIAIIDVSEQIAAILKDESPGYDIRVSCCEGVELYRMGAFDADVPDEWKHGGLIQPMPELLWRVDHQPSAALRATFRNWAIDAVLVVGLALSLAIGAIGYHSRRADERATAARKAERRLRTLNEELERRVEARTHDLDQALSDLNTINLSVAHDIRTPLNTASLTIESLSGSGLANGDNRIRRLKTSLEQISAILDRLLALSRVSSFSPQVTQIDMQAMAERVVDELEVNGLGSNIAVTSMPPARADATMVHILLTNLIGNAVKHAASGGIEIGSRCEGDDVVYYVRDHGPGIEPSEAGDLFTPKGRKHGDGGLGLGLAIAARAVSRHGGRIWLESTDGGGATFCFSFARPSVTEVHR